jgi:2-keto-4-pentenoate hydratase/2-oxohepta-3-ene-1,7-dioic acid hydratase in catechol pathway
VKVIVYTEAGANRLGVVTGPGAFVDVTPPGASPTIDLADILGDPDALRTLEAIAVGTRPERDLAEIALGPLVARPNAIWGLALNFETHIAETGLTTSEEFPQVFLRTATSLVPDGAPLLAPPPNVARAFDYEGELVVVVGRPGRLIPPERALEHVAGFTVGNEGSVREYQGHNRQFGLGKNFERSGSYGPWLMTPDEFGDIASARLTTTLNGVVRQDALLSDLRFGVEQVISYLSSGYTLQPGDLIFMGTPGALPQQPGDEDGDVSRQFGPIKVPGVAHMQPGGVCEVEISGLGVLRNSIEADTVEGDMAA